MQVFLVADVEVYRDALASALDSTGRVEVTGTADAVDEVGAGAQGILLVDVLRLTDLESLREMALAAPQRKIVALAVSDSEDSIVACAEAGCRGLVPKTSSLDELVDTLESVERGETIVSPHIASILLRRIAALSETRSPGRMALRLTVRERQVVDLIDEGLSNKAIAQRLCISLPTVKNHVHNILEKLEVDRRAQAVARVNGTRI